MLSLVNCFTHPLEGFENAVVLTLYSFFISTLIHLLFERKCLFITPKFL